MLFSGAGFGLSIRSAFPFPELPQSRLGPEVFVRRGRVKGLSAKPVAEGTTFRAIPGEAHLFWKSVGDLLVRGGKEVVVDPAPGVDERQLRLYILGPAMALLLRQRGRLVLHASALRVGEAAVLFLADSEGGKSSIAAALYARGHAVISDDVSSIEAGETQNSVVFPAVSELKLWPDAILALGHDLDSLDR